MYLIFISFNKYNFHFCATNIVEIDTWNQLESSKIMVCHICMEKRATCIMMEIILMPLVTKMLPNPFQLKHQY